MRHTGNFRHHMSLNSGQLGLKFFIQMQWGGKRKGLKRGKIKVFIIMTSQQVATAPVPTKFLIFASFSKNP